MTNFAQVCHLCCVLCIFIDTAQPDFCSGLRTTAARGPARRHHAANPFACCSTQHACLLGCLCANQFSLQKYQQLETRTLTNKALASSSLMAGALGFWGCAAFSVVWFKGAGCSILTYGPGGGTAATASRPCTHKS